MLNKFIFGEFGIGYGYELIHSRYTWSDKTYTDSFMRFQGINWAIGLAF